MARLKLARLAQRLNACCGQPLPALILMTTDDKRLPDPLAAAQALPRGSAVILRHRDDEERAHLGEALVKLTRQSNLMLLIAGDTGLARRLNADGVHFSESQIDEVAPCRTRHPNWIITAAAHSERALLRAKRAGADASLFAPVFPTKSHPRKSAFGLTRFRLVAARAPLPLYA
ncbi:MAG: thiamine phosphate synthase, partial [Micropepsaceae bacterium]